MFGLLIANGRSIPAEFTRFGPTGASVPDTWIGSEDALRAMAEGAVGSITPFSDHAYISFSFECVSHSSLGEFSQPPDLFPVMSRSVVNRVAGDDLLAHEARSAVANDSGFQ